MQYCLLGNHSSLDRCSLPLRPLYGRLRARRTPRSFACRFPVITVSTMDDEALARLLQVRRGRSIFAGAAGGSLPPTRLAMTTNKC